MTRYTGTDNVVLIPSEYKGKPVTTIGSYAFHNNTNLTSVIIPESITSIGFGAFSLCANLTNIILPENLTTLKETAFLGCTNLTQITLPKSLITIGHHAFGSCLNLIIYVKASTKPSGWSDDWNPLNRPVYFGVEEVLEYNGMQYLVIDGSITITYYLGSETELEIPSLIEDYQVTRIGDRAFENCLSLASVVLPESLISIGKSAYSGCINLKNTSFPENLTIIEDNAFSDCTSLTDITFPESLATIEAYAFKNCSKLTYIILSNNLTIIKDYAFEDCINLTIYVKATSKPSGWYYYWNSSNRPVYYGVDEVYEYSGMQYLLIDGSIKITRYVGNETVLEIPSVINEHQVTSIGDTAFGKCINLISIYLPETLTVIGNRAFEDCKNLIIYTKLSSKLSGWSDDWNPLNRPVYFGVEEIRDYNDLYYLVSDGSITITQYVGKETALEIPSIIDEYQVTKIGNCAFENSVDLTSITLPEEIISIGDYAFRYCRSLTEIILPESLTSIGNRAFENCRNLIIYTKLPFNPSGWSENWNPLNRPVYFEVEELQEYNGMKYVVINGNITITHYEGNETTLEVPSLINGYQVTKIGDRAFEGCTTLTNITLSEGLTHIGKYAFSECTGLTNITLPESLTSIGTSAFYSCISLTSITIPKGVTIIEDFAFFYCISLKIYAKAPSKPSGWSDNWNPSHRVVVWGA